MLAIGCCHRSYSATIHGMLRNSKGLQGVVRSGVQNTRIQTRSPAYSVFSGFSVFYSTQNAKTEVKLTEASAEAGLGLLPKRFDLNSIFILSVPITTERSFLYCHHKTNLLSATQRQKVPWLVKTESKLVEYATKGWNKLEASKITLNQKIVKFVLRLLGSIPYDESSLRSFPSQETMIREINESETNLPKAIMTAEIANEKVELSQLKAIPVYHPQFQKPETILTQMRHFRDALVPFHRKWAMLCAIGIPITLPVALVPVAPNVPGFYLAYRLYCHIQALRGARNLGHLIDAKADDSLVFQGMEELDSPYRPLQAGDKETLVVDSEAIEKIVEVTGLKELRDDLLRAYKQEEKRLKRDESSAAD